MAENDAHLLVVYGSVLSKLQNLGLFSCEKFFDFDTVALSFVFKNYY